MKALQRVTRETAGAITMLYLYYREGATIARTIAVTNGIAIDVDADGDTIGVELIAPGLEQLEALVKLARDRELALDGLLG